MSRKILDAVERVLIEAMNEPHFFDFSDAERLNWMIARAFKLGTQSEEARPRSTTVSIRQSPARSRADGNQSRGTAK